MINNEKIRSHQSVTFLEINILMLSRITRYKLLTYNLNVKVGFPTLSMDIRNTERKSPAAARSSFKEKALQ